MPHPATGVQQKGWTVVDCGIDNPATCDAWLQVEQQTLQGLPILRVLVKRRLDVHQTTFALGKAVAHLNLLWLSGQMLRTRAADGVYRFSAAPTC